jgi:hypothetical protein
MRSRSPALYLEDILESKRPFPPCASQTPLAAIGLRLKRIGNR